MYSVGEPQSGLLARGTDRLTIGLRGTRSRNLGKGKASLLLAFLVLAGCFFTIITIVPVSVRATTLYVGGIGPSNFTTIQAAVDSASPGDTIFVYNGTYHEQLIIAKTLTLVGENDSTTIIDGDKLGDVVYVSADWVNITGFTVRNSSWLPNAAGIELHWVNNCRVYDNNVSSNDQMGIYLENSHNNTIVNNSAENNIGIQGGGIHLSLSSNNTVSNNSVSGNAYGIYLGYSDNNTVTGNNASTNWDYGVFLQNAARNTISNNTFYDNWGRGVLVQNSENNTIKANTVLANLWGISLDSSGNNSIANNSVLFNGDDGIEIRSSYYNMVANNTITGNYWSGVSLSQASDNTVSNNQISSNTYAAIEFTLSLRNTLVNNVMVDGGVFFTVIPYAYQTVEHWNTQSIDTSNTVNGNPVQYWKDVAGGTVPGGAGQVILANCSGVLVENQNVSGVIAGVDAGFSSGNTVRNVTSFGSRSVLFLFRSDNNQVEKASSTVAEDGIYLDYSNNNSVLGSSGMRSQFGVSLSHSDGNTIANFTAVNSSAAGFYLDHSTGNSVLASNASGNVDGIQVWLSDSNTVANNTFSGNQNGARVLGSSSNRFVHNNFLGNTNQAFDNGTNFWNANYPIGGNYWSDYAGPDSMHGPNQNLPGSDGIGDTPRPIPGATNQDRYPLVRPFPPPPRAPPTAPMNLQATPGNTQVTLTWLAPAWDGLSSITNYTIYRGTVSGGESLLTTLGNVTTYLDTGLTNGILYYYMVAATNIEGEGAKSNEASARPVTIPGAPVGLSAMGGNAQVNLAWSQPGSNGGSPIANYTIYRGTTPGGEAFLVKIGNVLAHVDTGLTNGVTYYYKVAAINSVGEGPNSTEASATPLAVPSEPQNLQATTGNHEVTLTWDVPATDGGTTITNYVIYRGIVTNGETLLVTVGNVLSHLDTGLTNGVTYYYKVAAINSVGEGPNSTEASATPLAVPSEPQNLQATTASHEVTLTWDAPATDGGTPIVNYSIFRSLVSGGEVFLIKIGNVLTYRDTGLTNSLTYYYKVTAWNAMGEGPRSGEVSAVPGAEPGPPIGLGAVPANRQVTLTWSPPSDIGGAPITNYMIYRGTVPNGETLLVTVGNVLSYVDTGLTNGQIYYYEVSAKNSLGEGPKSNEASATPATTPTQPSTLAAIAGIGQVTLSWLPPLDNGGAPVTGYTVYRGTIPGGETLLTSLGNVLGYVDGGLANGATYYYQVSAVNRVGPGSRSVEASATTPTEPLAPRNLQAAAGSGQARLTWSAPASDGGMSVTNYRVFRGTNTGGELFLLEIGNVLAYTDTGLTNGQTYYYEVTAKNAVGEGPMSGEASATPSAGPGIPTAPRNLQAVAGSRYVTLTWAAPSSDGGAPITNYRIYSGTSSGSKRFIAEIGSSPTFVDAGLTNGQTCFYEVAAVNVAGEGPRSNEASATPLAPPGQVSGLKAVAGNGDASLSWLAPTDDGGSSIINYKVFRSTFSGGETLLTTLGSVLTYLDAGLTNGQVYYYKVNAVTAVGDGPKSNEVSATPLNRPPTCLISAPLIGVALSGTVTIAGTSSDPDGTVTRVEVSIDGGSWTPVDGTASWSYSWDTKTVADGTHVIAARSFDGSRYSGEAHLTVTVANAPPQGQDSTWMAALAVIVLAGLGAFIILRKRRGKEKKEKPPAKED